MNAEQIAALALDAGEGVASILAAVPDPAVRAGGTIAVGLIRAIRALTANLGPEKAAAVIRAMAETSHAITPEDLAGDDAELAAKIQKMIAERDLEAARVREDEPTVELPPVKLGAPVALGRVALVPRGSLRDDEGTDK